MAITLVFPISGMVCGHCVDSLTKALENAPGVESAHVTLEPQEAAVTFDPEVVSAEELAETIVDAGFETATGVGAKPSKN